VQEFQQIAAVGLLAAPLKPDLGGIGLGIDASTTYDLLLLLKQIGRGNLAVGRIYEGHVNALQIVQTFGTPEQIEIYAQDARDRDKIFGVWNAEAEDGVRFESIGGGRVRLQGAKTFCSGAGFVDRPFVNGRLPDGRWQMSIVPTDEAATVSNPAWWQPAGMRATASYKIDFSGVELDPIALIGQPDDYIRQPWLSAGVIRFAAVQLGAAEALFDLTCQYLRDASYTNHPSQQERIAQMAIALETGDLWLRGAADRVAAYAPEFGGNPNQTHLETDRLLAYCNMMRTVIEQICMDMMRWCERSIGTRGLLPPHPMERVIRDLTLYLRQPAYDAAVTSIGQYVLSQSTPAAKLWSNDSFRS
jgi:alkylation response protein AidB-like acyl-CoA dehydrogenase